MMSVALMTDIPIEDLTLLPSDLKPGQSVLVLDEDVPANTNVYTLHNGELVPDFSFDRVGRGFDDVLVSLVVDGETDARWLIRLTDRVVTGVEQCFEPDVSDVPRKLKALDEKYLTPRTLADLATTKTDYAIQAVASHEAEAAPLRERLAEAAAWEAEHGDGQ
jgi:hypothetical protein